MLLLRARSYHCYRARYSIAELTFWVPLTLPDHRNHNLYNIEPLKPLIDAGFTLLTPNFRIARRIKTVWDSGQHDAGLKVWRPVSVMPLEAWLDQRWREAVELGLLEPLLEINEGQAIELWQQVVAEHQSSSERYTLLRPSAATALASQAREMLVRWQVDVAAAPIRQEFFLDEDCSTFYAWLELFQKKLDNQGLLTTADKARQILGIAASLPRKPVALLDFDDIPPLYQACIDACTSELRVVEPSDPMGQRVARAFADKRSELSAAARWAKQKNAANPHSTVAIILPDMTEDRLALEYLLRREFDCLGGSFAALPVNFSAGVGLNRVPVVADALQLLALTRSRVKIPDIVSLLQSRFVDMPDASTPLAVKFVRSLFDDGREEVDIAELRYRASQVSLASEQGLSLGRQLLELSQLRVLRARHFPSQWAQHFYTVLNVFGWPGKGGLDSLEYQQVELWQRMLQGLHSYDVVSGAIDLNDALLLLERCAAREMFQPQTVDSPIQVLGILEGAGLKFDHLWICGLQAKTWPAPARPNPLVPLSLQRDLHMPHASAEREWAFSNSLFERYIHSAPTVNASYVQSVGGVPELPAALLQHFEWCEDEESEVALDPRWLQQQAGAGLESVDDEQAPVVSSEEVNVVGGGSGLLEDQSHCPFRAFAKRRLKLEPLGEFHVGLSASARGSILHDALYVLWGHLGDSNALASIDVEALDQLIGESANSALQALPTRQLVGLGQGYLALEGQRLQALLGEWVQIERQRSEFIVLAREQDVSLTLGPLEIKLRADRIDQLADGSQFIIDYKSGRSDVKDWLGDRPAKPQLLLYCMASGQEPNSSDVSALGFAQVRPGDSGYIGAGRVDAAPGIRTDIVKLVGEESQVEDWQDLNVVWWETLQRLVDNFVAGDAEVDPKGASSCSYCGLDSLCRIGDDREAST